MVTTKPPHKSQMRELPRWEKLLKLFEAGVTIAQLAQIEGVTTTQIYALLARGRKARESGWI